MLQHVRNCHCYYFYFLTIVECYPRGVYKLLLLLLLLPLLLSLLLSHKYMLAQKVLESKGYIYRGKYEGWYCISDEAFLSEEDVMEVADDKGSKRHVSLIISWFFFKFL